MKKLVSIAFLLLILSACSIPLTPSGTPTFTALPTGTAIATQTPTVTHLPQSETPGVDSELLSDDQPANEWNGIPIMPGALAGEGDEEGYVFTIRATPQTVQDYYQLELGKLGWQLASQEQADSSMLLIFISTTSERLTIHVIAKDEEALVLLVK